MNRGLKIVGSGRAPDLDPRVGSGRKFPTRFPAWSSTTKRSRIFCKHSRIFVASPSFSLSKKSLSNGHSIVNVNFSLPSWPITSSPGD